MSEHVWAWRPKGTKAILLPPFPRKTIEDLFNASSFGLPVREVPRHVPIKVKLDKTTNEYVEDTESEADRFWRAIVEFSSK
jgi:hypothetical protein